ncbi:hypothetical protein [Gordonia sp. DT101]|uniref:hypothetical protein n=1 Tax=Gordonia sp. DT101 TaxID=3416545 RepID=UPI003CF6621B
MSEIVQLPYGLNAHVYTRADRTADTIDRLGLGDLELNDLDPETRERLAHITSKETNA